MTKKEILVMNGLAERFAKRAYEYTLNMTALKSAERNQDAESILYFNQKEQTIDSQLDMIDEEAERLLGVANLPAYHSACMKAREVYMDKMNDIPEWKYPV